MNHAKDVTQVFYVKDMANKPKKNQGKSDDEPKRHIVLPGKRKIVAAGTKLPPQFFPPVGDI